MTTQAMPEITSCTQPQECACALLLVATTGDKGQMLNFRVCASGRIWRRLVWLAVLLPACANDGAPGKDGVMGAPGPTGAMGLPGAVGAQGQTGPTGSAGEVDSAGPGGPAGPAGETGPAGPKGDTGAVGPKGGGAVWKDSFGVVVPVVGMVATGRIVFVDGDQVAWGFDLINSVVGSAFDSRVPQLFYTTADCTGAAYVPATIPTRYTFFTGPLYYYRPDNAVPVTITARSSFHSMTSFCIPDSSTHSVSVIPESSMVVRDNPPLPAVLPIHVEYVP